MVGFFRHYDLLLFILHGCVGAFGMVRECRCVCLSRIFLGYCHASLNSRACLVIVENRCLCPVKSVLVVIDMICRFGSRIFSFDRVLVFRYTCFGVSPACKLGRSAAVLARNHVNYVAFTEVVFEFVSGVLDASGRSAKL